MEITTQSPARHLPFPTRGRALVRTALLGTAALAAGALPLVAPGLASPASAATTAYSTTTQWIGGGTSVNVRTAPDRGSRLAYALPTGRSLSIECQTVGGRLGFSRYADNRTWDRLSDGRYVHDAVTSAPGGPREAVGGGGYAAWSAGIPRCDVPPPAAAAAPVTAADTYPDQDAQDCSAQRGIYSWCKNGTEWSPRRFAYRNCTDYVAWRLGLTWDQVQHGRDANAVNWRQGWIDHGRAVGSTPRVGAVAWWGGSVGGGFGHVGVVTAVNPDGSAQVAQYNRRGDGRYSVATTRAQAYLY